MIRKFYDMGTADGSSAPTETQQSQPESIASIMAREGVKSSSSDEPYAPVTVRDTRYDREEESTRSTAAPANDYDNASRNDESNRETSQSSDGNYNWSENYDLSSILSRESPENVLRAMGYDDKSISFVQELKSLDPRMLGFFETWKSGGDVKTYLEEASRDFNQMSAEDVMRHQLRADYPKATEAQLDVLYKKEIVEKYKLNSYDEDEVAEGKLLLEAKADKYREQLAETQKEKILPSSSEYSEQQMQEQRAIAEYTNMVIKDFSDNPYTRDVFSKNAITIGEGTDKFVFPVDGKEIADLVINGDVTGDLMFDKKQGNDGSEMLIPKAEHQLLVATVNKYGQKFITELAKHYKSLGSRAAIEPIDNARPSNRTTPSYSESEPTTIAGAMAKYGRVSSGG
jgi:hypothetical protein